MNISHFEKEIRETFDDESSFKISLAYLLSLSLLNDEQAALKKA